MRVQTNQDFAYNFVQVFHHNYTAPEYKVNYHISTSNYLRTGKVYS